MKLCPTCQRHLRAPELRCPFCGAAQRSAASPSPSGPGLTATVLLGVMLAGCVDRPLDTAGSSEGGASSGGASTSGDGTTTTGGSSTGAPTTTGPLPGTSEDGTTALPSSTTDGSTNVDDSLDAGDEGCSFYAGCAPDVGPNKLECDPFAQDCPDGQKCAPWTDGPGSWRATKCVPVGDKLPGEACTAEGGGQSGLDDCVEGAFCWEVGQGNVGTCVGLCGGSFDNRTCPADQGCLAFNPDALFLCALQCDPLMQDCPGDDLCLFASEDFLCVLDISSDTGAANDPCEYLNGCDAGLVCALTETVSEACDENAFSCCTPFCAVPDGACPNPDQVCMPWFEMGEADPGDEDIGVCAIMP